MYLEKYQKKRSSSFFHNKCNNKNFELKSTFDFFM